MSLALLTGAGSVFAEGNAGEPEGDIMCVLGRGHSG